MLIFCRHETFINNSQISEKTEMNKFRKEFIERTGRIGKLWGIGESAGKIWGLLLFERNALTQEEIAKQLNHSVSLVSPALSMMVRLGLVSIVGKRKRKNLYTANASFIEALDGLFKNFVKNEVKPLINILKKCAKAEKDGAKRKRFSNLVREYEIAGGALSLLSNVVLAKRTLRRFNPFRRW